MTRRGLLALPLLGGASCRGTRQPQPPIPLHLVSDRRAKPNPAGLQHFWSVIWPEAVRNLGRGGIRLDISAAPGEIERPPGRQPIVKGLMHRALNVVVTDQIPMEWDNGRSINGVTMIYRGYHLCMVAVTWAHGNQFPVLSVNTCLHELLHALLLDIFEQRPRGAAGQARELRVDEIATRLWLLGEGTAVREPARIYAERLLAGDAR